MGKFNLYSRTKSAKSPMNLRRKGAWNCIVSNTRVYSLYCQFQVHQCSGMKCANKLG